MRRLPPIDGTQSGGETDKVRVANTPVDEWGDANWKSIKGITIRFE